MFLRSLIAISLLALCFNGASISLSTAADNNLPPYEQSLRRLSSIVGALMYLDPLCNDTEPSDWYEQMSALLKAEDADDVRKGQITDRFNQSYRTLANTYPKCNDQAQKITALYREEGKELLTLLRLKHSR